MLFFNLKEVKKRHYFLTILAELQKKSFQFQFIILMENKMQVNCSCSLIHIDYKISCPPKPHNPNASIHENHTRSSYGSLHTNKKQKISLSRPGSTHSIQKNQEGSLHSRPSSSLSESIVQKFGGSTFISKASQNPKIKKKFVNFSKHNQSVGEKENIDFSQTKNTTFEASLDAARNKNLPNSRHRITLPSHFASQFKKLNQEKPQKYEVIERVQRLQKPQQPFGRHEKRKTTIYESQNIQYSNSFSDEMSEKSKINFDPHQIRRIRKLKQLQYRYVQSLGKMTSQNHMSMVISEDQNSNELQKLENLIRKSSSLGLNVQK